MPAGYCMLLSTGSVGRERMVLFECFRTTDHDEAAAPVFDGTSGAAAATKTRIDRACGVHRKPGDQAAFGQFHTARCALRKGRAA